jgi:ribonuclease BN (tRNA processing enzyme)
VNYEDHILWRDRSCLNTNIQRYCKGVDVYYADAQYTEDEYAGRKGIARTGWGHSTPEACVREAAACGAKTLLLGHHDPSHDDAFLLDMETQINQAGRSGSQINAGLLNMKVQLVREGETFEVV